MSYSEILATCIAYFDMDLLEAKRCTMRDYYTYSIAYRLKEHKEIYHVHLLAWKTEMAGATKSVGKSVKRVYSKFDEFYDYEKSFLTALKGESPKEKKQMSIAQINMILNS